MSQANAAKFSGRGDTGNMVNQRAHKRPREYWDGGVWKYCENECVPGTWCRVASWEVVRGRKVGWHHCAPAAKFSGRGDTGNMVNQRAHASRRTFTGARGAKSTAKTNASQGHGAGWRVGRWSGEEKWAGTTAHPLPNFQGVGTPGTRRTVLPGLLLGAQGGILLGTRKGSKPAYGSAITVGNPGKLPLTFSGEW